jgi:DNA polymerase I-like protein with 3'-5' exonuclease and polymerase domains
MTTNQLKFQLPSVRKMFVPKPGYTIADIDLAGADAQVVAWEAGDEKLKTAFRNYAKGIGPKIHAVNAMDIFGARAGNGKVEPFYSRAKAGVHLTNYGGRARTCAGALGISLWEAEQFQNLWFTNHPEIKEWHNTVMNSLMTRRSVTNKFGFRKFYFERIDESLLGQALAWIPQSTVAITVNKAWDNIERNIPEVEIMLQVHDSLIFQYPTQKEALLLPKIYEQCQIVIPYDDPLIIPFGIKKSTRSWGDCADASWGV